MEETRKKELREAYKNYRPDMGVFSVRHIRADKVYLEATANLKGKINSTVFQLNMETFRLNKGLNKDWKKYGKEAFEVKVLETIDYDKDDQGGKDYTEALENLFAEWQHKLRAEGRVLY